MPKIPYICLYGEYKETFSMLSDEELGCLIRAMLDYWDTGEETPIYGSGTILWPMVRNKINRDFAAYEKRCEANRINGAKGGRPKKDAQARTDGSLTSEINGDISEVKEENGEDSAPDGDHLAAEAVWDGEKTDGFPSQPKEPNYNRNPNQNKNNIYNHNDSQTQSYSRSQNRSDSQTAGWGKSAFAEKVPDNRVEMLEYWKKRLDEHARKTS